MSAVIRPVRPDDRTKLAEVFRSRWGSTDIAVRGELLDALSLPGLIAESNNLLCGVLTYRFLDDTCEIVSLDALLQWLGIGTSLLAAVEEQAKSHGARRLLVVTTNDNLDALRFYQRRGFITAAIRPNALAESRKLKPTIPLTGCYGIPIRDEIELVREL
jgi:ribosomal protein S18 acetylase RimI-like enzyme